MLKKFVLFIVLLGLLVTPKYADAASYWLRVYSDFESTAGAALTEGDVVYISGGSAYKADANGAATYPADGIVRHTVDSGDPVLIVTDGILGGQSSLTVGGAAYLSTTAGGVTQVEPIGYSQSIGVAVSTTSYRISINSVGNNAVQMISYPHFEYIDEFLVSTGLTTNWVITTTEAGAGSASEVVQDANGGTLLITNDAADDDLDSLQGQKEIVQLTANKQTSFAARFKISDATQSDALVGIAIRDTTPLDASDGCFFFKDDGITSVYFGCVMDSTLTSAFSYVADTSYHTVSFICNGTTSCTPYVDGVAGTAITTNLPTDEILTPTLHIQNGEAVAKTMTIDYVAIKQER